MEILDNFGFEWTFFTAQVINFLILAFVFKKFLYKPVLKVLADRSRKIAKGLEDAESARAALEKANEERDVLIKNATLEAEKIIDETKKSAQQMKQEILDSARVDAQNILGEAKKAANENLEQSKQMMKRASVEISRSVLEKILSELFTKDEKEKILSRNIARLKDYD
jgi:F-type H+-transporting ATPase subunit b